MASSMWSRMRPLTSAACSSVAPISGGRRCVGNPGMRSATTAFVNAMSGRRKRFAGIGVCVEAALDCLRVVEQVCAGRGDRDGWFGDRIEIVHGLE